MSVIFNKNHRSPNFDERPEGQKPDMIIIHAMAMEKDAALKLLCNPSPVDHGPVSSHYLIDHEGLIFELVSPEKRAWHAGVSHWDGRENLNAYSIGIELLNHDLEGGEIFNKPFSNKQLTALIALIEHLKTLFPIRNDYILGHSDIAPERKNDPGPHFPWPRIRKKFPILKIS